MTGEPIIRGRTLSAWITQLSDLDGEFRLDAIRAIGQAGRAAGGSAAVPLLIEMLRRDPYAPLVFETLAMIGDSDCVDAIIDLLSRIKQNPKIRETLGTQPLSEYCLGTWNEYWNRDQQLLMGGLNALSGLRNERAIAFLREEATQGVFTVAASEILAADFGITVVPTKRVARPGCWTAVGAIVVICVAVSTL